MKKETVNLLAVDQDQALRTNYIKNKTDRQESLMNRLFGEREGTVSHAGGGGGTPIHNLYRYVPPKGVVILKLLI